MRLCVFGESFEQLVVGLHPFDMRFPVRPDFVSTASSRMMESHTCL
jgi:hypothetical protein